MGELTPENRHHRDYAKWKAAYIHNCLKNGQTPVPGPADGAPEREDGLGEDQAVGGLPDPGAWDQPAAAGWTQPVPAPRKPTQPTIQEAQQPGRIFLVAPKTIKTLFNQWSHLEFYF